MKFKFIDDAKKEFPIFRLCSVLSVGERGYFAWRGRPASSRQNRDVILLAHIRSQFKTSHEIYGSPRMHVELQEAGIDVGRHRVARLMRDNKLKTLQKRRYKKTTDSNHAGLIAPSFLNRTLHALAQIRNGVLISAISRPLRTGSIWQLCRIYSSGVLSDGQQVTGSKKIWH